MRHWLQLGIRNWRVKPGRTAGAIGAITLGVGVVVWVTCAYKSVRLALEDQVWFWIGRSHLSIESMWGSVGTVYQSLENEVRTLDNVAHVTARLKHVMIAQPLKETDGPAPRERVEATGIDPETEYYFREYDTERVAGRMIRPDDTDAAVMEQQLASQLGLKIGDRFRLTATPLHDIGEKPPPQSAEFTLVGVIEHRRVAKKQLPIVIARLDRIQALAQTPDQRRRVTKIDMILRDTSPTAIRAVERKVRRIVDREGQNFLVTTAEAKLRQVKAAETQTSFVLALLSSVALFTGFFIILSTLSIGMVERIGELGTLRCLGTTRLQVAMLVLGEAMPIGLVGIVLGIPVGIGLAQLSVWFAPEYIGQLAVSGQGLILALVGGTITTLAGAMLPCIQAMRVSPMAASRPQARPTPAVLTWGAAVVGVLMVCGHLAILKFLPPPDWVRHPEWMVLSTALFYGGYAMMAPALIVVVGRIAVWVTATALRLRPRLLSDQVGRAPWRSATICCGLMVGLSLIVSLVVHSESVSRGWDFPKDFAEAFVYMYPPIPHREAEKLRHIPGVAQSCVINEDIRTEIRGRGFFFFGSTTFVAGDPDGFFQVANLEFVEGTQAEAVEKLRKGGYLLVTPEFVRAQNIGYKQKVPIRIKGSRTPYKEFEVAGVVTSPALNIAASYFNAGGMLLQHSAHIVMGTFKDAERLLDVPPVVSLFLINFDLPPREPPAAFIASDPPRLDDPDALARLILGWRDRLPKRTRELDTIEQQVRERAAAGEKVTWTNVPLLGLFREALSSSAVAQWTSLEPAARWHAFREELVMRLIPFRGGTTGELSASVRALKRRIDADLKRATTLLASVPMVALLVAALGVGNLMMANVASRARQIAMLRAVGATKWQIIRLVIGEALVLGSIGSLMGVGIGLHAAAVFRFITASIWGFKPPATIPWDWVSYGVGFTMGVCLIAGLLPARRAARNNIIDALQTT
jgi:ABC-type lipoprotein release transport system permease subunit